MEKTLDRRSSSRRVNVVSIYYARVPRWYDDHPNGRLILWIDC